MMHRDYWRIMTYPENQHPPDRVPELTSDAVLPDDHSILAF